MQGRYSHGETKESCACRPQNQEKGKRNNFDNKDYEIRDYKLKINYDPDFFEFENLTWMTSGSNTYNVDEEDGVITINKANDGVYWSGSMVPLTVNMKVKKSGSTKITLSRNGENHFKNGNIIPDSCRGIS